MTALAPVGGLRPHRLLAGISRLEDLANGYLGLGSYAVGAKSVYFVDGNAGSNTNDGQTWKTAFATLTYALATSHADIASGSLGWAARNVIFVRGDTLTEDLTKLADKTDVIGVGSYDARPGPGLVGNHAIVGAYIGCRFINMFFRSPAGGGDIFTIPTDCGGLAFLGCDFDGASSTKATGAIITTTLERLTVKGCTFVGAFSDAVIELGGTEHNSLMISDNVIQGANVGIDVKSTVTTSIRSGFILRNVISSTLEGILDSSSKIYVHNNSVVTLGAKGSAGAGAIVAGAKMMLGNKVSCSDVANADVPALGTL
jgi:hypothetical protein